MYIEFAPDFSEDKSTPRESPIAPERFHVIKNYIPKDGILIAREGVSEFSFSEWESVNDFSGDANCVALWKFENNFNDSIGGNHLSAGTSPTFDNSDYKEGSYSCDFESGSSQYIYISDGSLDANFPGKNGVGESSFSWATWVKLESTGSEQTLFMKWDSTGGNMAYAMCIAADGTPTTYLGYNAGASADTHSFSTQMSTGKWYHWAVKYDKSTDSIVQRIRDGSTGNLLAANYNDTNLGDCPDSATDLYIGVRSDTGLWPLDAKLDEMVFFKDVLSDAEVDQIYGGTYG
jgi:hypothetical protein